MKKTFRNVIIFALALCFVSAALSLCACKKTPQTIETNYCAYSEIPADYTPEQAEADGCLVVYQSQGTIKNSTVMTDFAKTTKKGSPALLRVATYYEKVVTGGEPELVVVDIEYKDGIYRTHYEQVNEDGTKEAFDDKYKYLVAIDRVRGTSTQVFSSGYMLTNDEDVTYADYASSLSRDPSEWIDAYIIYLLTAVM